MIYRFDRSDSLLSASFSRGGCVAIYVKNSLHCRRINYEDSGIDLEYVCLEIRQHQSGPKFCFISIYRPNFGTQFYWMLCKLLNIASGKYNEIIVVGDFNVGLLTSSNIARRLSNVFRDNGMHQIVNKTARLESQHLRLH